MIASVRPEKANARARALGEVIQWLTNLQTDLDRPDPAALAEKLWRVHKRRDAIERMKTRLRNIATMEE